MLGRGLLIRKSIRANSRFTLWLVRAPHRRDVLLACGMHYEINWGMAMHLYRGVSEQKHQADGGRLIPAGHNIEIVMQRNDLASGAEIRRDGTFQRVPSEANTVNGHHLVSGIHGGCFISTSESFKIAVKFATNEGRTDGVVYVLDDSTFQTHGVVSKKVQDPRYPSEEEVSIRAADGGEIPQAVIIGVINVTANEYTPP